MEVRVLGKSPSWQDRGGACSGYLVQEGSYRLLLDCGSGVFGKLRETVDYQAVDAVMISHLHADHVLDLFPFASALSFSSRAAPIPSPRPTLHLPPGGRHLLAAAPDLWGQDRLESAFVADDYDPDEVLTLGPFTVRFCEVPHFTRTFACELSSGGRRFTFGADCAPSDRLAAFASGTDLLFLEATLVEPEPPGARRGHMSAAEAGALARRSGASRVVLTHFSDELDRASVQAEAQTAFGAPVELAREGACYAV